jgi:hypothetical protein
MFSLPLLLLPNMLLLLPTTLLLAFKPPLILNHHHKPPIPKNQQKQKKPTIFLSAHLTLNFLPLISIPSLETVSKAVCASSLIENETYPKPLDSPDPGLDTTNA